MAEFRTDPLRGQTVLINGQRGNRPSEFTLKIETPSPETCPFCRGHEAATPPSIEQDQTPDWTWRLFPNRYPAVSAEVVPLIENDFVLAAFGKHEVLVESAEHFGQACDYSIEHWVEIFRLWQRRLRAHYDDPAHRYVHIFRNQGYRGGATLVHPHQQIVALPLIPDYVTQRLSLLENSRGGCSHCDWLEHETADGARILEQDNETVCLVAFAPRFPFEWQIYPRSHQRFDALGDTQMTGLARVLLAGLNAMKEACGNPDFNLILFSTPPGFGREMWGLDILPRTSTQAGFEWGTGVHIVSTPPEEACLRIRAHWPK